MVRVTSNSAPALRFDGFDGEWNVISLSDHATFSRGKGYSKADVGTGTYPLFLYGQLYTNYSTEIRSITTFSRMNDGSVVSTGREVLMPASDVTPTNIVRASHLKVPDVLLGGDLNVITPGDGIDPTFLALELTGGSSRAELLNNIQGATVKHLHLGPIRNLKLVVPSVKEQRAIGELFADLDALIEQHRAKHKNLQRTKTALLQRMFPQDGTNEPELRLGGFSGAWETVSFDSLLTRVEIGTNILGSTRYHGVPLLKMGNIQRGFFDFSSFERLPDSAELSSDSLVRTGDFLFNTRNTMELVGKGATWMGESGAFAFNGNIARFTLERVDTKFFNYLYNHPRSIRDVNKCATGTTSVAAIYPRSLKSVQFQIPTIEEQHAIGEAFSNLDELIAAESRYITQLTQAKTALLQRMFV